MRLLLDTHTFLWWCADDKRLSVKTRRAIALAESEVWLSHASVWEMAIKASLGKLTLNRSVENFIDMHCELNGFRLLPLSLKHICLVEKLPWHHRDPFDRLLVAQAHCEDLMLASRDDVWAQYGVSVLR